MGETLVSCLNLNATLLAADVADGMVNALVQHAIKNQWLTRDEPLALERIAHGELGIARVHHHPLVVATVLNCHHSPWMPPQGEAGSSLQGVAVDIMRVKDLRRCCVTQVTAKVVPVAMPSIASQHIESEASACAIAIEVAPQSL